MKIIITEEQFNRFNKSSPALQNGIIKYLNQYIESGNRKIIQKSRNYNRKKIQGEQFNRFIKEEEEDNTFQFKDDSKMGKMINRTIKDVGFASTIRLFGGLDKIKDYIKTIDFNRKDKIEFIKFVFDQVGGTSFSEIYENPIPYDTDNENYHQEIAYMTKDSVIVDVYGGYEFNTHVNEYRVPYENLKDGYIDEIFEISLNIMEENDLW